MKKTQIVFRSEGTLKGQFCTEQCRKCLKVHYREEEARNSSRKSPVGLNNKAKCGLRFE